jgi:L-2,4-diaminobutyrate decarboxylase
VYCEKLERRKWSPWSVQRDGVPSDAMRNVKVICSENAHFSVQKNMAMMGMGFQSVVTVPVNENAQMDVDALEKTMAHFKLKVKSLLVLLQLLGQPMQVRLIH